MKSRFEYIIDWIVGIYLVLYFVGKLIRVYVDFSWAIPSGNVAFTPTTWFVSYAGGFVRRGLQGEVLYRLQEWLGIEPQYFIVVVSISLFIFLGIFFIRQFVRNGYSWWLVPLTFFLGGFEIDRTDCLAVTLMVGAVMSYRHVDSGAIRWLLINFLGVCAILVHELSFLLMVPMLGVLILRKDKSRLHQPFLWTLPMVVAFACAVWCHGTVDVVAQIRDSWRQTLGGYWNNSSLAGISSLGWTADSVVHDWANCFLKSRSLGVPDIMWFFVMICIVYVLAVNSISFIRLRQPDAVKQQTIGSVVLFQLIMVSPMAIVFFDSSRFMSYWISSSFLWFLVVPETHIRRGMPNCILWCSKMINTCVDGTLSCFNKKVSRYVLIAAMLCVGIPMVGMNLVQAGGRSIVGTYITFALAPVLASQGLLVNAGEGRPYCEVFAR